MASGSLLQRLLSGSLAVSLSSLPSTPARLSAVAAAVQTRPQRALSSLIPKDQGIVVDVKNDKVDAAYTRLKRELDRDGTLKLLRARQRYSRPSELKMGEKQKAYNTAVGSIIKERVSWVMRRRKLQQ